MQRGGVLIPSGYYADQIKVIANTLASQTQATATINDIWTGKTAWVNGSKLTGTKTQSGELIYKKFTAVSGGYGSRYRLYRVEINNIGMNPIFFYCRKFDTHQGSFIINDKFILTHATNTSSSAVMYNLSYMDNDVTMNSSKIATYVGYPNTTYYLYVFGRPL